VKNIRLIVIFLSFVGFLKSQNMHSGAMNGINDCAPKTISLAIHIVNDSLFERNLPDLIYQRDIDSLNVHFAPICIQFKICEVNDIPHNRWETMIKGERDEEIADMYNRPNMVNIFYSQTIEGGAAGFAPLGDTIVPPISEMRDAIFLQKGSGKNTIIHEFGHYFGLSHTFETDNGVELADGSNCETAGDKICDTPADDNSGTVNRFCEFEMINTDANGDYYTPDICNQMGYYSVCSYKRFTIGQYNRMLEVALKGRSYLW